MSQKFEKSVESPPNTTPSRSANRWVGASITAARKGAMHKGPSAALPCGSSSFGKASGNRTDESNVSKRSLNFTRTILHRPRTTVHVAGLPEPTAASGRPAQLLTCLGQCHSRHSPKPKQISLRVHGINSHAYPFAESKPVFRQQVSARV